MVAVTEASLNYEFDPIELEFFGKNYVIIPFKYINTSNVHHTEDSLYLELARASSKRVLGRDCICYIWFHMISYISEIKIRILEKESPANILNVKI